MSNQPLSVRVDLAERSYDIVTGSGLLKRAGKIISPFLSTPRTVIVTDQTVYDLHGKTLSDSLTQAGIEHDFVIRPAGEARFTSRANNKIMFYTCLSKTI